MNLSLATNFDDELIEQIKNYPVNDVYGKLSKDCCGGGRASYSIGRITAQRLKTHVRLARQNGITFTYLLNSSCFCNMEWTRRGIRKIRKLLDWLSDIEVDAVTVSTPYLTEFIKKRYPHFYVKIGIFANIDSPERAKFWENLGADMLTLESFSINRNLELLRRIRSSVSCRLQLIANFTCLSKCPLQLYHMNGISHASTEKRQAPFIDYSALKCTYTMLQKPENLFISHWIRPEDIRFYEDIGFNDFKLLERGAPTADLIQRVVSYAKRTSPENLLDIIQPYGMGKRDKISLGWFVRYVSAYTWHPSHILTLRRLLLKRGLLYNLEGNPIKVRTRNIPIDFFEKITSTSCARGLGCTNCGYCRSVRDAVYEIENDHKKECKTLYQEVFRQLLNR